MTSYKKNITNEKPHLDAYERAEKLIQALMDDNTSPELRKSIQGWFISEANDENKQDVFLKQLESFSPHEGRPSEESLRLYENLSRRLGFPGSEGRSRLGKFLRRMAAAASVLLLVGAGYWWLIRDTIRETSVAMGDAPQTVILPDSSRVVLEPNSRLTYTSSFENGREVALEGEAFFSVQADSFDVFTVRAGGLGVKVYGTEFRVDSHVGGARDRVLLYEGRLTVDTPGGSYRMEYGEELDVNRLTGEATEKLIPLREMLDGGYRPRLVFRGESLGDVFRALEAHYGVPFEIVGTPNFRRGEIYTDLEGLPLERVLEFLHDANESFDYTTNEMKIIITNKK